MCVWVWMWLDPVAASVMNVDERQPSRSVLLALTRTGDAADRRKVGPRTYLHEEVLKVAPWLRQAGDLVARFRSDTRNRPFSWMGVRVVVSVDVRRDRV